MRTIEVDMSNGKVACAYSPTERVDVETCYRCRRLRAFRDDESGTKVVCARPLHLRFAPSRSHRTTNAAATLERRL